MGKRVDDCYWAREECCGFCSFSETLATLAGMKRLPIRMVAVIVAAAGVVPPACGGPRQNDRQAALEVPVGAMVVLSND